MEEGMEIVRVTPEMLTSGVLRDVEDLFNKGFEKESIQRRFSWKNFTSFWEVALLLPWNALWFLVDDDGSVVGLIGGATFPNMLTDHVMACEICWRTSISVKGKGYGWELLATFLEWAIKERGATRIMTHRFLSKDMSSDDRFDEKIKKMGFLPSGCEYYMDI